MGDSSRPGTNAADAGEKSGVVPEREWEADIDRIVASVDYAGTLSTDALLSLRSEITAAIRDAVASEREACADIADGQAFGDASFAARLIAASIRARGTR